LILIVVGLRVAGQTQTALPETNPIITEERVDRSWDASSVRANIDSVLATLASVAVQEKISRFAGVGGAARKLDSFEAEVSIADGVEQYTGVKGRHRTYRHVSEIGGLWSFGEVVTMLRTTRDIIASAALNSNAPQEGMPGEEDATAQTVIQFQSPAANHQWFVTVDGRIYWLDFDGIIRISKRTGEIERLTWTSRSGPANTGIANILWDVNFRDATVAGAICTMPSDSIYRVVRNGLDKQVEWNLTRYAALGRYGSRANVSFEQ
jgi:hypothetical protein